MTQLYRLIWPFGWVWIKCKCDGGAFDLVLTFVLTDPIKTVSTDVNASQIHLKIRSLTTFGGGTHVATFLIPCANANASCATCEVLPTQLMTYCNASHCPYVDYMVTISAPTTDTFLIFCNSSSFIHSAPPDYSNSLSVLLVVTHQHTPTHTNTHKHTDMSVNSDWMKPTHLVFAYRNGVLVYFI